MELENNEKQAKQTIDSWKQAGLVERASPRRCDIEELRADRQQVRSTRLSFSTLSSVLCVAFLPFAFCSSSESAETVSTKFRHSIMFENGASKLKKSVSYSCTMDQAVNQGNRQGLKVDAGYGLNVYTPVHSRVSDLGRASGERGQSMLLRDGSLSSPAHWRSLSSGDDVPAAPYVYTRLQTQLFPQMRF